MSDQAKPLVEPGGYLDRRDGSQRRRRELEREWDAVEPPADRRDRGRVVACDREPGEILRGSVGEQLNRLELWQFVDRHFRRRHRKRRNPVDVFAGYAERFATGGQYVNTGAVLQERVNHGRGGSSTCSQLSRSINIVRLHSASMSPSSGGRPGSSATRRTDATVGATRAGSVTDASSTSHTPSPDPSDSSAPSRRASRVLPQPPAPTNVTNRESATSFRSSASSRCRPMKLVSSWGRLCVERNCGAAVRVRQSLRVRGRFRCAAVL